jgi:hypothetical protein
MTTRTPGTPSAALRALGLPLPIRVRTNEAGLPVELLVPRRGAAPLAQQSSADARRHAVEAIEEVWRVAEEWWRERPVGRTYVRLLVDGGRPLTVYRDEVGLLSPDGDVQPAWYLQRYATSEGALLGDSSLHHAAEPSP